jgi:hypothetical protein
MIVIGGGYWMDGSDRMGWMDGGCHSWMDGWVVVMVVCVVWPEVLAGWWLGDSFPFGRSHHAWAQREWWFRVFHLLLPGILGIQIRELRLHVNPAILDRAALTMGSLQNGTASKPGYPRATRLIMLGTGTSGLSLILVISQLIR